MVFAATNPVGAGAPTFTQAISLAQIQGHLGDATTSQGRALNNAVNRLEIGGIVFNYRIALEASGFAIGNNYPVNGFGLNQIDHRVLLVSDRISAAGVPDAIPDWFIPGTPLVAAQNTTTTAEEQNYPLRIHWQNHHGYGQNAHTTSDVSGDQDTDQRVVIPAGRKSIRLRLRLDDDQGLFWHFATRIVGAAQGTALLTYTCRVFGTIYYRFRF